MVGLLFHYIAWHYTRGIIDLLRVWSNFIWFVFTFFSIPLLTTTLFSPFHKLDEGYKKGLDIGQWLQTFTINTLMRFVGALVRTFIILIGLGMLVFVLIGGSALLIVWILAPFFVMFLIGGGFSLMAF